MVRQAVMENCRMKDKVHVEQKSVLNLEGQLKTTSDLLSCQPRAGIRSYSGHRLPETATKRPGFAFGDASLFSTVINSGYCRLDSNLSCPSALISLISKAVSTHRTAVHWIFFFFSSAFCSF